MVTHNQNKGLLKLTIITVLLSLGIIFLSANPAMSEDKYVHSLSVCRHIDQPFTNAQADGKFTGASSLLQNINGPCADEVACCVQMVRAGNVNTFGVSGDGHDVITTEQELDWVFEQCGNFKVVTSAQDCCGVTGAIWGCAQMGVHNTVILATAPADVWAHEFGHNQGLAHRDDCAQNIMHSTNLFTNSVNSAECAAFKAGGVVAGVCPEGPTLTQWGLIILVGLIVATAVFTILRKKSPVLT